MSSTLSSFDSAVSVIAPVSFVLYPSQFRRKYRPALAYRHLNIGINLDSISVSIITVIDRVLRYSYIDIDVTIDHSYA
jgi:hypothetical protein